MADKELYRSEDNQVLAGVCAGLAEYFDMDVNLVRIITALVVLLTFPMGLIAYLVAWLIVPLESEKEEN